MAQYVESVQPAVATNVTADWLHAEVEVSAGTWQAYQILYYGFAALFVIVGLDKFLRLLVTWDIYASPGIASTFHLSTAAMTMICGVFEILIGAAIALKPRYGSWAATVWLWLVAIDLLTMPAHFEIVVMTLGLSMAALAFTRIAAEVN
jgi:uncharacterized membrane protein